VSVQDALIAADSESRIIFWSPSAARTFGWSEQAALGQPLTMLMPEPFRAGHRAGIERVSAGGEPHVLGGPPVELVGLRADGTEFPIELTLGAWEEDGRSYYTGVIRDISERVRVQRVLTTQYGVAAALAGSQELDDGIVRALEAIGTGMGWGAGHLWVIDEEAEVLRCRSAWHADAPGLGEFLATSRAMTFERGWGLPGRVWESGHSAWLPDVTDDANFPRSQLAVDAGLHGAVALPLVAEGQTRGVVEFFCAGIRAQDGSLL